jgi:hypothetical protein
MWSAVMDGLLCERLLAVPPGCASASPESWESWEPQEGPAARMWTDQLCVTIVPLLDKGVRTAQELRGTFDAPSRAHFR